MTRRLLVLINPGAGRHDVRTATALDMLAGHGVSHQIVEAAEVRALNDAIRRTGDVDAVFIAGGDGTINAALPALIETGLPLAILPTGTANDLARTLAVPPDPADAIALALTGTVRRIDVGTANDHPFCNVAHIGFGARVHGSALAAHKRRWGAFGYALTLLSEIRRLRPFSVVITCDGETRKLRTVHVSVGNGVYYGGGVPIATGAAIDDGRLDVCVVPPLRGLDLLHALRDLRLGGVTTSPVWRTSARDVVLHTRRPRRVRADGEQVARTPVHFTVRPGALRVIAAPATTA